MRARVIVLAGPSGAGKSRLAARLGLPVLRLDDYYKSGPDPTLPRIAEGPNAGLVDWDDPASWVREDALAAIATLCAEGRATVPVYDIARDGRFGEQALDLQGSPVFLAEGIFAQEVVPAVAAAGRLAAAYCVTQPPLLTFWRRLARDLRERRKPPLVLLRRGMALLADQPRVVRHAEELGCVVVSPEEALVRVRHLLAVRGPDADPGAVGPGVGVPAIRGGLPQPDQRTCGAASLVVARMLADQGYAARLGTPARNPDEPFGREVVALHARLTRPRVADGRAQLPWPRALGTPPWAVAAHQAALTGVPHRSAWLRGGRREATYAAVLDSLGHGHAVPLYVGSRTLPRHVVLVVDGTADRLRVYDPARGGTRHLTREQLVGNRVRFGRWRRLWWAVLPTHGRSSSGQRTQH